MWLETESSSLGLAHASSELSSETLRGRNCLVIQYTKKAFRMLLEWPQPRNWHQMLARCGRAGTHSVTGGSARWLSLFGKTVLQFFMELNKFVQYDPVIISLVFTQRSWKCTSTQRSAHGCSQQFHSQLPKLWSKRGPSVGEWINKLWYTQTMEYYSALKRNKLSSWKDMEETYMHITKWKRPFWKGYILYDSNDMTFWKWQNYRDCEKISRCQG